jgi:hypothetical protein
MPTTSVNMARSLRRRRLASDQGTPDKPPVWLSPPTTTPGSPVATHRYRGAIYVTDLRHFDGIELDPDAQGPALRFARYLRRIVRAATTLPGQGVRTTALVCRRRPGHLPCPGRLCVERRDIPAQIRWGCPACGEEGVISGWRGSSDDLSATARADYERSPVSVVLPERAYRLLLDELELDRECGSVLYGAQPHPDGVELTGHESDFEELMGVVAVEANYSPTPSRRRRLEAACRLLDPGSRSWLEHSTDVVVDELGRFELVASRAHVTALVRHELATVAKGLDITEASARRYLGEESLRELARQAAVVLADEHPGAELRDEPRTIPASLPTIGRIIAALAEAAHVRVDNDDAVGAHGALQVLSLLGQLINELPAILTGSIFLPQAALTRGARLLEGTAQMIREGAVTSPDIPTDGVPILIEAFARDARTLRTLVSEHGTSSGPLPLG